MDPSSNPGSATPETLYRMYKDRGALLKTFLEEVRKPT